jgi:transposase
VPRRKLISASSERAGLVRSRTALINTARGLTKSYGERLRGCNPRNVNPEKAQGLSPELQAALEPLLAAIEALSEGIYEYNQRIEKIARESYPQVARLEQVKGVGTLIALTYLLTLEDPHRFRKSRDVGCYVGLQPGRRNSGQSEPQMHISKEGDPYLRTLLVQGAHHILGPFGADSDLRRWGLKLAERGEKNGKKRAVIATARKLAVLLHRLWVSGEPYQPLRNKGAVESLYRATLKIPLYLKFDDSRALAVKAIWALGRLKDPAADEKLRLLAQSNEPIVREEAANQLRRKGLERPA